MAIIDTESDVVLAPKDDLGDRFNLFTDTVDIKSDDDRTLKELDFLEAWRDILVEAARGLNEHVHDGREKSLALTKLEEALQWAEKAVLK